MKKSIYFLISVSLLSFFFFSCASLQKDVVMSTDSFIENEDVDFLEEQYTQYDAKVLLEGKITPESKLYMELDNLEKDIDATIAASGGNKILLSRLNALNGLTNLLQGKKQKAKSFYAKSIEANKGDSYTAILGFRLGEVKDLGDENIISGSNQSALLVLEQGLTNYSKGEYSDCVAKLDSAFINLPDFYRTSYDKVRQNAWDLRNNSSLTDDKNVLNLLNKSQITIGDMIIITQETTDLFVTLTAGKKHSESDLFNRLKNAGYFNNNTKRNTLVVRASAASYLWNLYCNKKGLVEEKNKYSELYIEKVGQSPIPDVDLYSEYFDAVIGTVEHEIMSLPDGINFEPEKTVSAADFNSWLQQIR